MPHIPVIHRVQPILLLACRPPACKRNIQNVNNITSVSLPFPINRPAMEMIRSLIEFSKNSSMPYFITAVSSTDFGFMLFSHKMSFEDMVEIFTYITSLLLIYQKNIYNNIFSANVEFFCLSENCVKNKNNSTKNKNVFSLHFRGKKIE